MKRDTKRKYCIIKTKGNIETILDTFDNENNAVNELQKIRDNKRITSGVYEAASISVQSDGKLDKRDREMLDYYCPEVEIFLNSL